MAFLRECLANAMPPHCSAPNEPKFASAYALTFAESEWGKNALEAF